MTIESALSDGGRPWLGGEVARSLVALGCGFVLAVATVAALLLVGGRIGGMGLALVVYAGYGAAYALLTDVVFRGRTAEQIGAALGKPSDVGWVHRWVLADVPGPGVAVFFAMVALGVAAWILPRSAQFAGRGSEGLLMAAGAGVVLAAWAMVVVTYALHYAHQDSGRAQLDFPVGPAPRRSLRPSATTPTFPSRSARPSGPPTSRSPRRECGGR